MRSQPHAGGQRLGQIVIAGGAGFLGSHLADYALREGYDVVVYDNLDTGSLSNIGHLFGSRSPGFTFIHGDVREPIEVSGPVSVVFNLASPASPPVYSADRLGCLQTNSVGAHHAAEFAMAKGARLVQASTSEVYGDPLAHPQVETDWGNVNPVGARSCYDEGKRYAEAFLAAARHEYGLDVGIARIFNTYGPRMHPEDGRVVSGFVRQALAGEPLTVYGDGTQTRSFCYVSDLVRGLWAMGQALGEMGPINLGNPEERTIGDMAVIVRDLVGSSSEIVYEPLPSDDPTRRRPDITRAGELLHWGPEVPLEDGLREVVEWQASLAVAKEGSV